MLGEAVPGSVVTGEPDDRRATDRSAGVRLTQSGLVPGTMARSADWSYGCVGVRLDKSRAPPTNRAARCDSDSSDITLQRSVTAEDQGMVNSIVDFVPHGYSFVPDSDPVDASCSVLCSVRENFPGELDYLKPIIESLPDDLTESQKRSAINLVLRNADVFSKHDFDLGVTNLLTHCIDTGHSKPLAEPLRRHPIVHLDLIDQTVEKMLDAGIIEEAASPWCANIVLVAKSGSSTRRVTVDYRRLNFVTYKSKIAIPRVNDCLDAMNGSVFFSTLDLTSSFNQVPMHPDDRDKTVFITRRGQYRYRRMPMGGANAPGTFCRLMSLVLKGLNYITCLVITCLVYVDDTVILGQSFESHAKNLEQVLDRFR